MKLRIILLCMCISAAATLYTAMTGCGDSRDSSYPDYNVSPVVSKPLAAKYWVSMSGSDDNPGTAEKPFRTLAHAAAAALVEPRDIYVVMGTYYEQDSITVANGVSIYGGWRGTTIAKSRDPLRNPTMINFQRCKLEHCGIIVAPSKTSTHSRIDGLTIKAKSTGIQIIGSSPIIADNTVGTFGGTATETAIKIAPSGDNMSLTPIIERNTLVAGDAWVAGGTSTGIGIVATSSGDFVAPIIRNNTISGGDGMIRSAALVVHAMRGNIDALITDNLLTSASSLSASAAIGTFNAAQITIERNTIIGGSITPSSADPNSRTFGIAAFDGGTSARPFTIVNNFIFGGSDGAHADGIYIDKGISADIGFNTIIAGRGTTSSASCIATLFKPAIKLRNNILCSDDAAHSRGVYERDLAVTVMKNNLFCGRLAVFYESRFDWASIIYNDVGLINGLGAAFAGNITGSPDFRDATNHDYHLKSGSDGIDAGSAIEGITVDIDGTTRIYGPAPDIGAHEYP